MPKKLLLFVCPKCQTNLAWASEVATVYCKKCDRWVKASDMKSTPIKLNPDNDQLLLF
jgi:uncharacterized protein YbaR (Trm112 family)